MSLRFNDSQPVGDLVTQHPTAASVLHRHGIDFCCGGGISLAEAAARRGVDAANVLREIEQAERRDPDARRWDEAPIAELVGHILQRYHRRLDEQIPFLGELAHKVADRHGDRTDYDLVGLRDTFDSLVTDLVQHMAKEEIVLFPWILRGQAPAPTAPIGVMRHEHDDAAVLLRRLRTLSRGYRLPDDACASWTALFVGLEELERELMEHIHLENNVLFPRALGV